jgi:hypothetical protein
VQRRRAAVVTGRRCRPAAATAAATRPHSGSWYLFYSGNRWQQNYYSTGIAYCGSKLDEGVCRQMPDDHTAWFAYVPPEDALPPSKRKYPLPGNKRGPGAMDVYRARDGQPWVTWNYLSDTTAGRKSRTARLRVTGSGSTANFKVGETIPLCRERADDVLAAVLARA